MQKAQAKVVIADDDLDDHLLIREALIKRQPQIEVFSVFNGLQLLDLLEGRNPYQDCLTELPDLIILDLNMPLMDGILALAAIKKTDKFASIPVYILSTSKHDSDKQACQLLGAAGFFTKASSSVELERTADLLNEQLLKKYAIA